MNGHLNIKYDIQFCLIFYTELQHGVISLKAVMTKRSGRKAMPIEYCLLRSLRVVRSMFTNISKETADPAIYPDKGGSRLNILNHRYTFAELRGDSRQRSAT